MVRMQGLQEYTVQMYFAGEQSPVHLSGYLADTSSIDMLQARRSGIAAASFTLRDAPRAYMLF